MAARPKATEVPVRIEAIDPPGNPPGDTDVVFGVQRRNDVEQLAVADRSTSFEIEIGLVQVEGVIDFNGPFVHGRKGDRFLYVVWGLVTAEDEFERFARAKLMLNDIPAELVEVARGTAASSQGEPTLICSMQATNHKGHPSSGTLRAPLVSWS